MRITLPAAATLASVAALGVPAASATDYPYSRAPISAPISAEPAAHARGTVMLVHAGGWLGPDQTKQQELFDRVGPTFLDNGYRVVSIDYAAGEAGLQSVEDAIGQEIVSHPTDGPLCLYGESAGGHLSLLAAEAIGRVDCVATYGAPTDFESFKAAAEAQQVTKPGLIGTLTAIIEKVFGTDQQDWSSWAPADNTAHLHADVALMMNADDPVVPLEQMDDFRSKVPTTETFTLPPQPDPTAADVWVHGSTTPAGKMLIRRRLLAFVNRAARYRRADAVARQTGCADAGADAETSPELFRSGLACVLDHRLRRAPGHSRLATAASLSQGRRVTLTLGGHVTAARVAQSITARPASRRLIATRRAHRLAVTVTTGAPSRVELRVG